MIGNMKYKHITNIKSTYAFKQFKRIENIKTTKGKQMFMFFSHKIWAEKMCRS